MTFNPMLRTWKKSPGGPVPLRCPNYTHGDEMTKKNASSSNDIYNRLSDTEVMNIKLNWAFPRVFPRVFSRVWKQFMITGLESGTDWSGMGY